MNEKSGELETLRAQVDAIDEEILDALSRRIKLVEEIGRYKAERGIEAVDENRRDALLKLWIEKGEDIGLSKEFVTAIYNIVHDYSVSVEKKGGNL